MDVWVDGWMDGWINISDKIKCRSILTCIATADGFQLLYIKFEFNFFHRQIMRLDRFEFARSLTYGPGQKLPDR